MKKLLFLILIVFLFSCKEDTFCWQCEIKISYKALHYDHELEKIIKIQRCDLSKKKIKEYEKANNTISVTGVTDYDAIIIILECECKKK